MIAMVDTINEKPIFKGKFKSKSFCKWLKINRKKYVIAGNDNSDTDNSDDYDKGKLINSNKPVVQKYRRPGLFKLFTPFLI
jgi:hypothetical protein